MATDIDHASVTATLEKLRLGVTASELHGSLTGWLCAGSPQHAEGWLDALQLAPGDTGTERDEVLQRLYRNCRSQVDELPVQITPLLPPRTQPVAARMNALVAWCRGFLGGFGLGLGSALARQPLDSQDTEILRDLDTIAASRFDVADGADDARTLADATRFVAASCALLHRQVDAPTIGDHLH